MYVCMLMWVGCGCGGGCPTIVSRGHHESHPPHPQLDRLCVEGLQLRERDTTKEVKEGKGGRRGGGGENKVRSISGINRTKQQVEWSGVCGCVGVCQGVRR